MSHDTIQAIYAEICRQRKLIPSERLHFRDHLTVHVEGDFSPTHLQVIGDAMIIAAMMENLGYRPPPLTLTPPPARRTTR